MAEKLDDIKAEITVSKADTKSSRENDEDVLKCPICFEFFKKPKNLPCLHTFCEACLGSYILSLVNQDLETKNDETETKPKVDFKCPICRVVVPVSDQTLPPEEWAGTFTTNNSLLALLDKKKLQKNEKLCDPCQMDNKDVTAKSWCKVCNEALCETCSNYHRKFVMSKQHKLLSIVEQGDGDYEITRFEYCEIHKDRQLELFCFDHDQPCCVSCLTIYHRKCDHLSLLSDAAKDAIDKPDVGELKKVLDEMEKLVSKILENTKLNMSDVRQEKQKMLTRISDLRVRINTHLDEIQSKLEQDVKSFEKQHVSELNGIVFDLENRRKRLAHYRNFLGTVSAKAANVHIFLEMKKLKKKQEEIRLYLESALTEIKLVDCTLKISPILETGMFDIVDFGIVKIQHKALIKDVTSVDFPIFRKMLRHNSKMFSSNKTLSLANGSIIDAVFLLNGEISVSSRNKIYFIDKNGTEKNFFEFQCSVYGIDIFDENRMIVALYGADKVIICDFGRKMVPDEIIKVTDVKWVSKLDNLIIAASSSRLIVLDIQNRTIKKAVDVTAGVESVALFDTKVLYTNSKTNTLYCITLEGNKVFEYQHPELKRPRGVTTDEDGYIFVVGHDSSNVHQVSPQGEHINIILTKEDGIKNPTVICFDKKNKKLLVTHSGNKVNIYQRGW